VAKNANRAFVALALALSNIYLSRKRLMGKRLATAILDG
jgi:hypothetical protein